MIDQVRCKHSFDSDTRDRNECAPLMRISERQLYQNCIQKISVREHSFLPLKGEKLSSGEQLTWMSECTVLTSSALTSDWRVDVCQPPSCSLACKEAAPTALHSLPRRCPGVCCTSCLNGKNVRVCILNHPMTCQSAQVSH